MEKLLILLVGMMAGYLIAGWRVVRNANENQPVEFWGELYKVFAHDDPIFSTKMELDALKKQNQATNEPL